MMGTKVTAHCLAVILLYCCIFFCSSAAHHRVRKKHFAPAVVVGAVFCDTCFLRKLSESSRFISGATVAIECRRDESARPSFRKEVLTDRRGVFRIRLPAEVTKHVKSVRPCSVNLIRSSDPFCAAPSTAALLLHRFKSRWQAADVRVLSAGIFAFKPLQRPEFCDRRRDRSSPESEQNAEQPAFFFPTPNFPFLPSPPSFLPPNPLQPPPSVLPPLPFQPSPPPFVNLPPLPFLTPPPPPPAFQLPPFPFPFPPSPLFPGIPPAFTSKNASP
ncbi:pollen allergen Che a 1-like [Ananas comosus]|uniref:Pollen allergen Che a 1-like n=1 Tax=Ananas comosus TaxID=4615 RepID=A0A6P5GEJ3_ANACO|nr:pollen allergen Che a 1-like [Ananas comosus]